jgi:hypothetical protein
VQNPRSPIAGDQSGGYLRHLPKISLTERLVSLMASVAAHEAKSKSPSRGWTPAWRTSVRWFAGEFIVVVSGVLAALAMQSWYQARQDRDAERVYVEQLQSDLDASMLMLRTAIAEDSLRAAANAWLLDALHQSATTSPDSTEVWLRYRLGYYSDPRPVLGTVNTLIETGDIKLIRDAQLRSRIVAYASLMATDAEELSRHVTRLIGASDVERLQWERVRTDSLEIGGSSRSEVSGTYSDDDVARLTNAYARTWPVLKGSSELRSAIAVRRIAFASRVFYLRRMMASTEELDRMLALMSPRAAGAVSARSAEND